MSLGDLGSQLNKQGGNLYNQQRERMLREAAQMKERQAAAEADRIHQDISHRRLQKQSMEGEIGRLEQEIRNAGRSSMNDHSYRNDVSIKERRLQQLRNEKTHLEGEIMTLQNREHGAHNLHYNQPHYF